MHNINVRAVFVSANDKLRTPPLVYKADYS